MMMTWVDIRCDGYWPDKRGNVLRCNRFLGKYAILPDENHGQPIKGLAVALPSCPRCNARTAIHFDEAGKIATTTAER